METHRRCYFQRCILVGKMLTLHEITELMKLQSLNKVLLSVAAAGVLISMAPAASANVADLPQISVKGEKCYYYDVLPKESIYQVAQKLGITRDKVIEFNPSAADGLKPKMRLFFPVKEFAASPSDGSTAIYAHAAGVKEHVVKKGETLYGIARQYGMSPDELARLNPSASNGLRTGDVLRIASETGNDAGQSDMAAAVSRPVADQNGMIHHTIQKGETLFGIANSYDVPLEAMLEANPSIDPLRYKTGQVINVPVGTVADDYAAEVAQNSSATLVSSQENTRHLLAETIRNQESSAAATDNDAADADETAYIDTYTEDTDASEADEEEAEPLNVAVMLPFMLNEPTMSRTTQLYTEFFKGMLMGADALRNSDGAQVRFHFFDTSANMDSVRSILARPVMEEIDLVVAPDNSEQLAAIVESVGADVPVLNIFAVKDEGYRTHRNLIQTNIPHDAMYAKAIDMFLEKYAGALPVFLNRPEGMADKESFTDALKKRLKEEGRDYREIIFNTSLSDSDLAGLDPNSTPLVFVPNSGSKTEFAKFINALTSLRENCLQPSNVTLFGYPEWVTFRGESFDEICGLEATIYSRFMANDSDFDTRRLKEQYKDTYGTEMFEAVPTQGILGYDIATFIVNGLREKEETGVFPPEFDGVQSYWRLGWSGITNNDATGEPSANGGLVNEALYFINYRPGGAVEWKK